MDPLLKDWLTVGFSSAALIVSCASFYLSWRNYRRDSSRLKINLEFDVNPGRGSAYTVRMINVGRRPASITRVYARLKNGKRYPVMDTTTVLAETQFKDLSVPMAGFRNEHPLYIIAFEVEDTTGKVYKARTWKLWWHIRKIWKPEMDK
jgi:hypothetical protein